MVTVMTNTPVGIISLTVAWAYGLDEGISAMAKLKEAMLACEKDFVS